MDKTKSPLVSVIIPVFNAQAYIGETLDSVISQTYANWEVIIVDDGSTDKTLDIVRGKSGQDLRFKVFKLEKNSGIPAVPRNFGIRHAVGKYLAFLDADDFWDSTKLKKQVEFLEDNPETFLVYTQCFLRRGNKNRELPFPEKPVTGSVFKKLYLKNFIPCFTVMMRNNPGKSRYFFSERLKVSEDYLLWLEVARKNKIGCIPEPLGTYRIRKKSISHSPFPLFHGNRFITFHFWKDVPLHLFVWKVSTLILLLIFVHLQVLRFKFADLLAGVAGVKKTRPAAGRIKIAHIITGLEVGGAEMMLLKIASTMDRARFNTIVISLTGKGVLSKALEDSGITVFALGMKRGRLPTPGDFLRLIRIFCREKPDIVQGWMYHANLIGFVAGKVSGAPKVMWNVLCSYMDLKQYPKLTTWVFKALSLVSPMVDAVVINSESGRVFHQNTGYKPKQWRFIPNGFDMAVFSRDAAARSGLRRELGLPEDCFLIGLVARFDPMKDHQNFLRAAKHLILQNGKNIHFILVGKDIEHSNRQLTAMIVKLGISERIHLLGPRTDVPRILSALDVTTSSSYGEGSPSVIGEAMACGVPCAVTDVGDSASLVGSTGKVVPPKNPEKLADAWLELLSLDCKEREELGLQAKGRIQREFSLPAIVKKYEEMYYDVLNADK